MTQHTAFASCFLLFLLIETEKKRKRREKKRKICKRCDSRLTVIQIEKISGWEEKRCLGFGTCSLRHNVADVIHV